MYLEALISNISLARLRRAFFYFKCSTGRLVTTNRSEKRRQLFIKRVKV